MNPDARAECYHQKILEVGLGTGDESDGRARRKESFMLETAIKLSNEAPHL